MESSSFQANGHGDTIYPIHFMDQSGALRSCIMSFTFRYDEILDPQKLHRALLDLLEIGDWRKLGGRLRQTRDRNLEIHVHTPRVRFSHTVISTEIDKHSIAGRLPKSTGANPSLQESNETFKSLGEIPNIQQYLTTDTPLLGLHITSFKDATLVALTFPHCLADAMGTSDLLRAWSSIIAERDVKPLAVTDVLASVGTEVDEVAQGEFILEDKDARGFGLASFMAHLAWDKLIRWNVRSHHIYLPAEFMKHLHQRATDDMQTVQFISDGDIITAWLSRMILSSRPKSSATIYNLFDLRQRLSAIKPDVVYMQNLILPSSTMLSSTETLSMGEIALRVRQSIVEQTTDTQIHRLMRLARKWLGSCGTLPLFASWDSRIIICTNWTKAKFFEAADFGPGGSKPSMFWAIPFGTDTNPRDSFMVYGSDGGNYWLHATLREETWRLMEQEFEDFKSLGEGKDS